MSQQEQQRPMTMTSRVSNAMAGDPRGQPLSLDEAIKIMEAAAEVWTEHASRPTHTKFSRLVAETQRARVAAIRTLVAHCRAVIDDGK